MHTSLEKLDSALFHALPAFESAMLFGGGAFTFVGMTNIGGAIERDHEWDEPPAV